MELQTRKIAVFYFVVVVVDGIAWREVTKEIADRASK